MQFTPYECSGPRLSSFRGLSFIQTFWPVLTAERDVIQGWRGETGYFLGLCLNISKTVATEVIINSEVYDISVSIILTTDRPTTSYFENFEWRYLRKGSSDPFHFMFGYRLGFSGWQIEWRYFQLDQIQ